MKKAFIIKDFNDSGTEQSFKASEVGNADTMPEIEDGAFVNYEHAGLVRAVTEDDTKASKPAAGDKAKTTA